jgi:HPt (histidine-containing phosphotransfer) domain-containing protein
MDMKASLKMVGGDGDLDIKVLKTFVGNHAGDHALVAGYLAVNNIKEAHKVTHSLKGVAHIVGANELYDSVTKLDRGLVEGKSSQYQALLADFKVILLDVIRNIEMFLSETQGTDVKAS